MPFSYDRTFAPPFPRLPVVVTLPESSARSSALSGLVDTGADATLVPAEHLQALEAEEIYRAQLRSHWGESRTVAVYLVDLQVADHNLPGIEVIADDLSRDVLLGRNVLNRLILLLDGPASQVDALPKRPPRT
jgi:predicted aspartyl protease